MGRRGFERAGANEFFVFCAAVEVCAVIAATAVTLEPGLFIRHLAGFSLLLQGVAAVGAGGWRCLRCVRRGAERNIRAAGAAAPALLSGLTVFVTGAWLLAAYGRHLPGAAGELPVVMQLTGAGVASAAALYIVRLRRHHRRLRRSGADARKYVLAQRLRHHFLFNTLNTTACLIESRSDIAARTLVDLSELFRVMLRQRPTITLAEETEFVRRYIRIERVRLGNRLGVEWRVPDVKHMRAKVPTMVMQPLVENAIYHGIETCTEGGIIRIHIEIREDRVFFDIRNPVGDAMSASRIEGNRMALKSVRERLFHAYGAACRFTHEQRHGEYRVAFSIPEEEMR